MVSSVKRALILIKQPFVILKHDYDYSTLMGQHTGLVIVVVHWYKSQEGIFTPSLHLKLAYNLPVQGIYYLWRRAQIFLSLVSKIYAIFTGRDLSSESFRFPEKQLERGHFMPGSSQVAYGGWGYIVNPLKIISFKIHMYMHIDIDKWVSFYTKNK